jgi:hypothetical protein
MRGTSTDWHNLPPNKMPRLLIIVINIETVSCQSHGRLLAPGASALYLYFFVHHFLVITFLAKQSQME